ncbi:MAG: hypothetical protein AB2693_19285, partial [Candidatus Thiodiazotropha sp.]
QMEVDEVKVHKTKTKKRKLKVKRLLHAVSSLLEKKLQRKGLHVLKLIAIGFKNCKYSLFQVVVTVLELIFCVIKSLDNVGGRVVCFC